MQVIVIGKDATNLEPAVATVKAAGFEAEGKLSVDEGLAAITAAKELFAVVCGGAVDDDAFARLEKAAKAKGARSLRTSIGSHGPKVHFEENVVPQLEAARAVAQGKAGALPLLGIVVASVREGRFAETAAKWMYQVASQRFDVRVELVDLRDYAMPFFDSAIDPFDKKEPYPHESVERWTKKVASCDGFVWVSPEYNHGPPGVFKNALDWVFHEWNRKPVTFVAYGSAAAARAVEQLRLNAVQLAMVPTREAVHLRSDAVRRARKEGPSALVASEKYARSVLDDLCWWTRLLAAERARAAL
jgi:NAD(P)H-dependent FMN reductase